jgi:ferredoxin-NAD(P)+ reductase (naphthalene dioxygenase ferredoxin-specific)
MQLVVEPLGRVLTAAAGANLLETLRQNGIPVSYSCMAGRCGTCRCRVLQGEVLETGREAKITDPHAAPHVLACRAVLADNCTIEIPEPDEVVIHPARVLRASVVAIEEMTRDIRRVLLRANKPLSFSPGQYAMLQFSPQHVRPYSMAGLPGDDTMEFHVRVVPEGRVSGYVAGTLRPGDAVRVSGPLGTAYLRERHAGPMLCVAGGTGLAPVLSIVRGALQRGMANPIHVYFGVRTPADVYGLDWLLALAERHPQLLVHLVVATGNSDPGVRSGPVTDAVAKDWPSLAGWRAYLCGAPPMVEAASVLVQQRGVRPEHVHADAFYASST